MGDLGLALELMHAASSRISSLTCAVREWRHHGRSMEAFERYHRRSNELAGTRSQRWIGTIGNEAVVVSTISTSTSIRIGLSSSEAVATGARSAVSERTGRLFVDGLDRLRFEVDSPNSDHMNVTVRSGDDLWRRVGRKVEHQKVAGRFHVPAELLLTPHCLLTVRECRLLGRESVAGREAIRLALPGRSPIVGDPASLASVPGLPPGADDVHIWVDVSSGILLRMASRLDGEDFDVHELHDVVAGTPLSSELFALTSEDGDEVVEVSARGSQFLALEDVDQAPFTVLLPHPGPASLTGLTLSGPATDALASLSWLEPRDAGGTQVTVWQRPAGSPVLDGEGWETLSIGGEELRVRSHSSEGGAWWAVEVVRSGTRARVQATLERDRVIAIARSLRPAASGPPEIVDLW